MTKAASNGGTRRDDVVVGFEAVERHVKTQVDELHNIAALLRDVAVAQEKYANDYAKLPITASPANLGTCPPLQRVAQALETTLTAVTQAHTGLATELNSSVAAPLEAFERQQRHQTKQLLSEIDSALQTERQLHAMLTSAVDKYMRAAAGDPVDDNQDVETTTPCEAPDRPSITEDLVAEIRGIKVKRDRERDVIHQRLAELDLTDEQQSAILQGQLRRCFDVMANHANRVLTEVAATVASSALASSSQRMAQDDWKLDDAVLVCNLHIDATSWMIAIFSQIIPIEETIAKRLQTLLKAHPLLTIATVFAPSSIPSSTRSSVSSPEHTTLWDLAQSHKQLTANLADPIGRTLRFSKQKQETIRKELMESMDETQRQVQTARGKVKDKESKLLQFLQQEQSQQQRLESPQQPLLGNTGADAVLSAGLSSTLGLRNAVVSWTKQISSSPKKPLFKSKSVNSTGTFGSSSPPKDAPLTPSTPSTLSPAKLVVEKSLRRMDLEKELADARTHLQMLETNEVAQRNDMIKTLESTSIIGLKTMELMVSDNLKNVTKAITIAATATTKCTDRLVNTVDRDASVADAKAVVSFRSMALFDDSGFDDAELDKRLGDTAKTCAPETNVSETETEDMEDNDRELVTNTSKDCASAEPGLAATLASFSLPSERAVKERLRAVVTDLHRLRDHLQIPEHAEQILILAKQSLGALWSGLSSLRQSIERSPQQWQCSMALAIVFGLLCFVRRLGRLDEGWRDLAELQQENARSLQQLVALLE